MRVCQFRHDGKWTYTAAAAQGPPIRKAYISILQTRDDLSNHPVFAYPEARRRKPEAGYSSFALIVILAFSTFDTGQPFSAASAYF